MGRVGDGTEDGSGTHRGGAGIGPGLGVRRAGGHTLPRFPVHASVPAIRQAATRGFREEYL